jgi:hypothetical protein
LRHGAFLHRPYRLAGVAVEHENKSLLGRLDHDIARALAGIDARQRRLRRQIVIPDIVMHGLIRPHQLAGSARSATTELAWSLLPGRLPPQKSGLGEDVGKNTRPRSSSTDIGAQTLAWTGDDAIMHQRIETPARQPGRASKARTVPGGASTRRLSAIADRHDDAADDHRGRRDLEFAGPFQRHADLEPDLAIGAEIGAGNAGPRVERDHARVVGAHEDSRAAGGRPGALSSTQ